MPYQSVEIINSTNYAISCEISYLTVFCHDTEFTVEPHSSWESEKRICPIVEILAFIKTPAGVFLAKPYTSIGTTHNLFEIIETQECNFRVVRKKNVKAKNNPWLLRPIL